MDYLHCIDRYILVNTSTGNARPLILCSEPICLADPQWKWNCARRNISLFNTVPVIAGAEPTSPV